MVGLILLFSTEKKLFGWSYNIIIILTITLLLLTWSFAKFDTPLTDAHLALIECLLSKSYTTAQGFISTSLANTDPCMKIVSLKLPSISRTIPDHRKQGVILTP